MDSTLAYEGAFQNQYQALPSSCSSDEETSQPGDLEDSSSGGGLPSPQEQIDFDKLILEGIEGQTPTHPKLTKAAENAMNMAAMSEFDRKYKQEVEVTIPSPDPLVSFISSQNLSRGVFLPGNP
eukprot:TRINITY_DN9407_c0_g1_i2.p1 TRINITY_DN9407_c0_g1~~TRINITY_DN9407_c0_g1_i2.p1  ORF type:complete len:124 (-),score=23.46 TRINITY_DN9407_c0_g1_i2:1132-1503(-)